MKASSAFTRFLRLGTVFLLTAIPIFTVVLTPAWAGDPLGDAAEMARRAEENAAWLADIPDYEMRLYAWVLASLRRSEKLAWMLVGGNLAVVLAVLGTIAWTIRRLDPRAQARKHAKLIDRQAKLSKLERAVQKLSLERIGALSESQRSLRIAIVHVAEALADAESPRLDRDVARKRLLEKMEQVGRELAKTNQSFRGDASI